MLKYLPNDILTIIGYYLTINDIINIKQELGVVIHSCSILCGTKTINSAKDIIYIGTLFVSPKLVNRTILSVDRVVVHNNIKFLKNIKNIKSFLVSTNHRLEEIASYNKPIYINNDITVSRDILCSKFYLFRNVTIIKTKDGYKLSRATNFNAKNIFVTFHSNSINKLVEHNEFRSLYRSTYIEKYNIYLVTKRFIYNNNINIIVDINSVPIIVRIREGSYIPYYVTMCQTLFTDYPPYQLFQNNEFPKLKYLWFTKPLYNIDLDKLFKVKTLQQINVSLYKIFNLRSTNYIFKVIDDKRLNRYTVTRNIN